MIFLLDLALRHSKTVIFAFIFLLDITLVVVVVVDDDVLVVVVVVVVIVVVVVVLVISVVVVVVWVVGIHKESITGMATVSHLATFNC